MQIRRKRSQASSEAPTDFPFIPTEGELHELISARAYELYMQRATRAADELADWLTAETEVRATIEALSAPSNKTARPAALPGEKSRVTLVRSKSNTRKTPVQHKPA